MINILAFSLIIFLLGGAGVYVGLLVICFAAAVYAILRHGTRDFSNALRLIFAEKILFFLILALAYSWGSMFWSTMPYRSLSTASKLLAITGFFAAGMAAIVLHRGKGKSLSIVTIILCIMPLLLFMAAALENKLISNTYLNAGIVRNLDKGLAYFVLLSFPLYQLFRTQSGEIPKRLIAIIVTTVIALACQKMFAAMLAYLLGLCVLILCRRYPVKMIQILFSTLLILLFSEPLILAVISNNDHALRVTSHLPLSWQARMDMWKLAWVVIMENPIVGHGFDATRSIMHDGVQAFQNHPHNIILQIWVELGAVGALLTSAILLAARDKLLAMHNRGAQSTLLAITAAYSVFALVSFSAWAEWWYASLLMAILAAKTTENKT